MSFTISYLGIHVICLFYPTFFILYLPKVTLFPIILCVIPGRHHFRLLSSSVYQLNHYPFEAPIFLRIYRNIFTYLLPLKQRTKNEMKKSRRRRKLSDIPVPLRLITFKSLSFCLLTFICYYKKPLLA